MFDEFENNTNGENEEETRTESVAEETVAIEAPVSEEAAEEAAAEADAPAEDVPEEEGRNVYSGYTEVEQEPAPVQEETPCVEAEKVEHGAPQQGGQNNAYSYQAFRQAQEADYRKTPEYQPGSGYQQNPGYEWQQPAGNGSDNEKNRKGLKVFLCAVAIILAFALGAGVGTFFKGRSTTNRVSSGEQTTADTAELTISDSKKGVLSDKQSASGVLTPAQIAEKVRESNVGIVVYSGNSSSAAGEGSGVVMGVDSTNTYTYIITCAHVIDDAGIKCTVQTEDGQSYESEIVGFDIRTDLGVLKVKTTALKPAEFGNSDDLAIGDPVYAVGNPGGVEFFGSFTGGFVSAINRPVSSEIGYTMKCIQHDASINPGNSGGMLVNQFGQVVGINSQKIASTEYEGMGFAIPTTSAKSIIDAIIKYSYVPNRPKLGITYYPVSASTQYNMIAQIKGLPAGTLIINEIGSDSSLANTEARKYDMIIAVNGKDLTTADVLLELIDKGKVGDKLTLTLCRVNSNYQIDEFDVEAVLVEDKGEPETTTTAQYINPFDYFYNFGY